MNTALDLALTTTYNKKFRSIINTMNNMQLVVMHLDENQEIGEEVHEVDQFIYIVEGDGIGQVGDTYYSLFLGVALNIPAGTLHNVKASTEMKLFTIYAPPEHMP
jgi:mannose-6-phosphate isomerase-like protein (cupin superfamily)